MVNSNHRGVIHNSNIPLHPRTYPRQRINTDNQLILKPYQPKITKSVELIVQHENRISTQIIRPQSLPFTYGLGYFSPTGFNFRGLKSYLFYGDKGNGKSLVAAFLVDMLLREYHAIHHKYPNLPLRTLRVNTPLNSTIETNHLGRNLSYWTNPRELLDVRNSDIIWDEVGKDFPASSWVDTPREIKQIFSHLRKRGNRLFSNTQVYNDIDISFRRQVDRTFHLNKIVGSNDISATLPPVNFTWGLIMLREMDKNSLENETDKDKQKPSHKWSIPRFVFIERKLVSLYDTTKELPPYRPTELEHIVYTCHEPDCTYHTKIEHRKF